MSAAAVEAKLVAVVAVELEVLPALDALMRPYEPAWPVLTLPIDIRTSVAMAPIGSYRPDFQELEIDFSAALTGR